MKRTSGSSRPEGHALAGITLTRVNGSHCGENTYVSFQGREIGSAQRGNPETEGKKKRWKAFGPLASSFAFLGCFGSEDAAVRRIAQRMKAQRMKAQETADREPATQEGASNASRGE